MDDRTEDLRDQLARDYALQKLQAFYDGKTGTVGLTHAALADAAYNFADNMLRARASAYEAQK